MSQSDERKQKMKIVTLLKVTSIELDYHSYKGYAEPHGEPYTQISVDGFVLLGVEGCVLDAGVQINAEYGFTDDVRRIKEELAPGTIHWIESENFFFEGDRISFYGPEFTPVDPARYDDHNSYFPVEIEKEGELADDEFCGVAGRIYREGAGKFFGHKGRIRY